MSPTNKRRAPTWSEVLAGITYTERHSPSVSTSAWRFWPNVPAWTQAVVQHRHLDVAYASRTDLCLGRHVQALAARFERLQQRHYGMKLMAYTLMNLRVFCGIYNLQPVKSLL